MILKRFIIIFSALFIFVTFSSAQKTSTVLPGAYQTTDYIQLLKNKHIAVVANQTSVINSIHIVDSLINSGADIKLIFAPEHGFRGNSANGESVKNSVDSITKIKIVSLYGDHDTPTASDLKDIQIVVYDIQDLGVRFFTYISTLQNIMEACAENNIKLLILDRPDPHGNYIDGPVLESEYKSFVGKQSVPVVYGMTPGEYALMLNGEQLLKGNKKCDLQIVKMLNWDHTTNYTLPIKPSPNLPNMESVNLYPSICFFEGTKVSIGRGTLLPFQILGYPGNKEGKFVFTPVAIPGTAINPPYENIECEGTYLQKEGLIQPEKINLKYLLETYNAYPDKEHFFNNFFNKLAGNDKLKQQIISGMSEDSIRNSWKESIEAFKIIRKKYLLYRDFE